MTKLELQEELTGKLKECGFANVKTMVRNYSTSKAALEKAISKADKILEQKGSNKTKYTSIYKQNITDLKKNEIFDSFESLGYTVTLKGCRVGPKSDVSIWVASKGKEVIVYSNGCFDKQNDYLIDYFTEDEYKIIKEA